MKKGAHGCPDCNSKALPRSEQPEAGTHAVSMRYECGSEVVYVIGGNYWEWATKCPTSKLKAVEVDDGK